jgi:DNA replicative helicase MCM subunit Mcm2 (Cdc46/Mcm family)
MVRSISYSRVNLLTGALDMDKMISIKGLVIRTTPVIPDMKTGRFAFHIEQRLRLLTLPQHSSVVRSATMQSKSL